MYVDPEESVLIITTGMDSVNAFEGLAVDMDVYVEGAPETVVVRSMVMGYTRKRVVPLSVCVTVVVVTETETPFIVVV